MGQLLMGSAGDFQGASVKLEAGSGPHFSFPGSLGPQSSQTGRPHTGPQSSGPVAPSCPCHIPLSVGVKNSLPRLTDILCLAVLSWPVGAWFYFSHESPELQGLAEGTGARRDCCWPRMLRSGAAVTNDHKPGA